ncbi:hypothetical protein EZS27_018661 [termite gut metagenome]|uniref:Uncharacterized protein n=1 Tax=termite gut metagenome TaxID=433724 RepID=A0A5J4RGU5_9ZZZZ
MNEKDKITKYLADLEKNDTFNKSKLEFLVKVYQTYEANEHLCTETENNNFYKNMSAYIQLNRYS